MIKTYHRARYREKFRRYRIFFVLLAVVFAGAFLAELFLYGDLGYRYDGVGADFAVFFSDLFAGETMLLLILFLFGITLYAPILGFVCSAARGGFTGFCLSVLFVGVNGENGVWLFLLTCLYLLLSAWIFLSYTTFCTTTALQIYSSPAKNNRGGEKRMYGGTLFYSAFSHSINWRFLLSYVLFFLAAVFFSFLLSLGFAAIRSLL